jgi:hypothetical protein
VELTGFSKRRPVPSLQRISDRISTEDGMKQAQEKGLFKTRCVDMVRISAEILSDLGY